VSANYIVKHDMRDELLIAPGIHAWVGSPPYWGQRRYGDSDAEIGRPDQPLDEYLDDMEACARTLFTMTHTDGVGWLNMGDTNAGSGGAGGDYNSGGRREQHERYRQGDTDLANGQICLVPYMVAERFRRAGWLVRQDITWVKTTKKVEPDEEHGRNRLRPEDESHVRRPLFSTEHIFMLTKTNASNHRWCVRPELERGNAWHFPPARGNGHAAPFPDELVRRCLMLTFEDSEMSPRHVVFDPWAGSGTTIRVAQEMGFSAWGTDIYGDPNNMVVETERSRAVVFLG
jgi:DNA modification methylase